MTRLTRSPVAIPVRRVAALVVASAIIALVAGPVAATAAIAAQSGVEDFSFDSYDADYYLSRDAANHAMLKTVETFVARFPNFDQNRGIIRSIPDDYNGVPLHTTVASVTDGAGKAVPYAATDDGSLTQLALGTNDFVHGRQTYQITYTQQNVVRHFANSNDDEFYWDTNGTGFAQHFGSVTARVHVDASIASLLTGNQSCYRGAEGSTAKCDILRYPAAPASAAPAPAAPASTDTVFTAKTTGLGGNQTMTIAIGFTSGSFVQVPASTTTDSGSGSGSSFGENVPLWSTIVSALLALGGVATLVIAAIRRLFFVQRDSRGRGIIIPQYSVPKGLDLLEAASILTRTSTGISAQLVSFAVRGNVSILDYKIEPEDGDYSLRYYNDTGVDAYEQKLLVALFGADLAPGALRQLGVTTDCLADDIASIQASVADGMVARGFRVRPSATSGIIAVIVMVAVLLFSVAFTIVSGLAGALSPIVLFAIVIAFIGIFISAGLIARPAVLTDAGAEQRDYLLGMRDYLQLVEADRFRVLQSPEGAERIDVGDKAEMVKLYEKLLPFAVLWGVEKEWSKELAVYYDAGISQPDWYSSNSAFNSLLFTAALVNLQSSVIATSTPPASSGGGSFGGGSFGGGFSGGGGGGGGGGGR